MQDTYKGTIKAFKKFTGGGWWMGGLKSNIVSVPVPHKIKDK